ncbi:MAG TPA: S9 family peptidase [Desulfobacteria bacterium]|nr:S9 family peptidase [Desulfobacteria bacterium]
MDPQKAPYISWNPALSAEEVFSDIVGLQELLLDGKKTYWLEMRPAEKGRYVIVRRDATGTMSDVTPTDINVRTRVHEYGGGAYTVFNGVIYCVNFSDQRLYRQFEDSSHVEPLTPEKNEDGSLGKYASLTVSPDRKTLLFVYEKEYEERENENFLAVLDIDLTAEEVAEPRIIAKGCDFYAEPIFSPTGKKVAWLQWNHPHMPWDSTELMVATFDGKALENVKKVAGGDGNSICFPRFDGKNMLYFVMDTMAEDGEDAAPGNWWNLYRYTDEVEHITAEQVEFGEPHWVFGQRTYDFLSDNRIIAKMVKNGRDYLVLVDPETKSLSMVDLAVSQYSSIIADAEDRVFFIGASTRTTPAIYSFDLESKNLQVLRKSSRITLNRDDLALPEFIAYPTADGEHAYAFLYLPKNRRYRAPENDKPPLLVLAHGGPTARTTGSLSFIIQFWTSAGFAVIDVDYRGSTGYGRRYRDALRSRWGIIDAEDVADAVRYIIREGKVDESRIAVRGGSAGGYMVQRVMTQYPDLFGAGASYYGIGNLITLVTQTHKFESRYIENLVGAKLPEGKSEYAARSPINHLEHLKAPMILFQGSADKIVTPENSREVARALRQRGIETEYVEYEGEAHGFRIKANKIDALDREFRFLRKIFRAE